jgi:hypothetical protein
MHRSIKHLFGALFLLMQLTGLSSLAAAQDRPSKLVIGLLPGESAPTVIRLNEPLRAYLEKRLGIPVEMVVGANYAARSPIFCKAVAPSLSHSRGLPIRWSAPPSRQWSSCQKTVQPKPSPT